MNFIEVQDKQTFDKIYSDMEKQFPKSELRPYEKILNDTLSEKPYKMVVLEDNGEYLGYVTYFEKDFIWVDYLCHHWRKQVKRLWQFDFRKTF